MFSKKPTPKEVLKQQNREIRKTQREVTRDYSQLERQEKSIEIEIKKAAKQGNKQLATQLAKQLIVIRNQKTRNIGVKSKVTAIGAQMNTMQSNVKMAESIGSATKVMGVMNKQMNVEAMSNAMQQFEKESIKMNMADEMINDTLDNLFDESGDEEEQDAIVSQVLDEIGIEFTKQMPNAPQTTMKGSSKQKVSSNEDKEIEDLLAQLKAS
ncbi:charged multivesicular body protein 2b [Hydra vulgaris]|uniref:Charged multivesicular body protein 2b n=1 Tax=Hydra vulgaris TaxID=6087 RepID=A0ABM4CIU6_HYDVU|nr:charged multivesicular body protein 2b [Hydra vulgaris]